MQKFTRRRFLTVAAAVPLAGILTRPAGAAEFMLKFANGQDPTHPVNKREPRRSSASRLPQMVVSK